MSQGESNAGEVMRIIVIKNVNGIIKYYDYPYADTNKNTGVEDIRRLLGQRRSRRLSKIEKICLMRGGTITDIRKEK